jgi:hypothetical protein
MGRVRVSALWRDDPQAEGQRVMLATERAAMVRGVCGRGEVCCVAEVQVSDDELMAQTWRGKRDALLTQIDAAVRDILRQPKPDFETASELAALDDRLRHANANPTVDELHEALARMTPAPPTSGDA